MDLRTYLLPCTGVIVQLGSSHTFFKEPREGVGLPVDGYIDDVSAPVARLVPRLETSLAHRTEARATRD